MSQYRSAFKEFSEQVSEVMARSVDAAMRKPIIPTNCGIHIVPSANGFVVREQGNDGHPTLIAEAVGFQSMAELIAFLQSHFTFRATAPLLHDEPKKEPATGEAIAPASSGVTSKRRGRPARK